MQLTDASGPNPVEINLTRSLVFTAIAAGIVAAIVYRDHFDAATLELWIMDAGIAGPIVFMLVYALGTVLFLPGSILTLTGGALFGPILGTLYNLTGATIGATLAFLVARTLASHWVQQKTGGKLKQLKEGVEGEGWRFVAFVRLVPLFPFSLLNYALGLTRIKLIHYVIASYVCMLPGAIAYTYLGYASREAITGSEGTIQKALLALALLAVIAFLPRLIGRIRRGPSLSIDSLKQKLYQDRDLLLLDVRTAEEFTGDQGHIANATNIPVEVLAARINEITHYTERPVAIICRTDKRSIKAAQLLIRKGFCDAHIVNGGMKEWNRHGYHIEH